MKLVDTKGLRCPAPLIKTRQALNEASAGESLQIIIDNQTSLNNIRRFLSDNQIAFSVDERNSEWILTVDRGETSTVADNAESYCSTASAAAPKKTVIAITSDLMGSGDEQLGQKLIVSFFKVLPMVQPLPSAIVIYNAGVKLAVKGSVVEEYLKELENMGMDIVLCTTCLDYFGLSNDLAAGRVGDMYQILNIMNEADNIIKP